MQKLFIGLVITFLIAFLGMVGWSVTPLKHQNISAEVREGKRVWQRYGCTECHTLFGNGGYNAPDLTRVYQKRGKSWLGQFFAHPPLMRPGKIKLHPALKPIERQYIIHFLAFVAKSERMSWPPENINRSSDRSRPGHD